MKKNLEKVSEKSVSCVTDYEAKFRKVLSETCSEEHREFLKDMYVRFLSAENDAIFCRSRCSELMEAKNLEGVSLCLQTIADFLIWARRKNYDVGAWSDTTMIYGLKEFFQDVHSFDECSRAVNKSLGLK